MENEQNYVTWIYKAQILKKLLKQDLLLKHSELGSPLPRVKTRKIMTECAVWRPNKYKFLIDNNNENKKEKYINANQL